VKVKGDNSDAVNNHYTLSTAKFLIMLHRRLKKYRLIAKSDNNDL